MSEPLTFWRRRSIPIRFGAHRYFQCKAANYETDHFGWFATGRYVPEVGRIRWGHLGQTRAFLDSIRLAWRHR